MRSRQKLGFQVDASFPLHVKSALVADQEKEYGI